MTKQRDLFTTPAPTPLNEKWKVRDDFPGRKAKVTVGRQHHEAVDAKLDKPRLEIQEGRVLDVLLDKEWHTLFDIAEHCKIPHGSAGSQIRNLRVDGWNIEKRRAGIGGTWEYRLAGRKDGQDI
jgi:hypothetical protein